MKKVFQTGIAVILLLLISCTKEPLPRSSIATLQTQHNGNQKTALHYIGERFGGGVIFALNSAGTHGLIADTVDLGAAPWQYNVGPDILTGATDTSIGTGPSNTRKIIKTLGTSYTNAAIECARSVRSGYTDWFLPSKDELNKLYKAKHLVGGFFNHHYYSSSEYSLYYAWSQGFGIGHQRHFSKDLIFYVRAIRAF